MSQQPHQVSSTATEQQVWHGTKVLPPEQVLMPFALAEMVQTEGPAQPGISHVGNEYVSTIVQDDTFIQVKDAVAAGFKHTAPGYSGPLGKFTLKQTPFIADE